SDALRDRRDDRDGDGEDGAGAGRAADEDVAAVVTDDAVNDGQAEAGALGLGGEVGREELGARLLAEAGAVVGHLELDAPLGDARGDANAAAAAGHGVARVLDEVDDDLGELLAIG